MKNDLRDFMSFSVMSLCVMSFSVMSLCVMSFSVMFCNKKGTFDLIKTKKCEIVKKKLRFKKFHDLCSSSSMS